MARKGRTLPESIGQPLNSHGHRLPGRWAPSRGARSASQPFL